MLISMKMQIFFPFSLHGCRCQKIHVRKKTYRKRKENAHLLSAFSTWLQLPKNPCKRKNLPNEDANLLHTDKHAVLHQRIRLSWFVYQFPRELEEHRTHRIKLFWSSEFLYAHNSEGFVIDCVCDFQPMRFQTICVPLTLILGICLITIILRLSYSIMNDLLNLSLYIL